MQSVNSAWTQRSSSASGSNGQTRTEPAASDGPTQSVNGFNAGEIKAFLSRDMASVETYRPAVPVSEQRAWAPKRESISCCTSHARGVGGLTFNEANATANNQPFLPQLAKQVATLEGGG